MSSRSGPPKWLSINCGSNDGVGEVELDAVSNDLVEPQGPVLRRRPAKIGHHA